jgi:integrase/recombinase XerD
MTAISFLQASTLYLNFCQFERKLSPLTCKAYRLDLQAFGRFLGERANKLQIASITRQDAADYLKTIEQCKGRTIRRKLVVIRSIFTFLEREGLISTNPIASLRLRTVIGRQLPRSISLRSIKVLFEALNSPLTHYSHPVKRQEALRDIAIFETLFLSGMRVSELSNLRRRSLDLDRSTILVSGKGNRERIIPLCSEPVNQAIHHYLHDRGSAEPESFLFRNRRGGRLSEQSIRVRLRRYAEVAGLGRLTPHMIRHTVATLLLTQGADLRNIQILLGHSSIATTTIYTHVNESQQRQVLTALHPRNLF